MTLRRIDSNEEQELANFLDRYLYPNIQGFNSRRCIDREEQLIGMDVVLSNIDDSTEIVIDEKAQLHYINNNLPTFAFEVDSLQRGNLTPGWLFNERYVTTHYMLIYPNAVHSDLNIITENDFTKVGCLLIERLSVIQYLEDRGWNKSRIEEKAIELRENNDFGRHKIPNERFSFVFTEHLAEQPINIVIRKEILSELSCQIFNVSNKGIE